MIIDHRRLAIVGILSIIVSVVGTLSFNKPVFAFDNGIPEMVQYKNKPKYPGTKPLNIGLQDNGKL